MRAAHQRSGQSWNGTLAVCALMLGVGCSGSGRADTIWPPADFELAIEEVHVDDGAAFVARRFRAFADGLVAYGTASRAVVDAETGTALPVFERLSVYRLVPTCIRALARRIDRCGIRELDPIQGERSAVEGPSLVVLWQAFGRNHLITVRGRVHGAMAEVLAIVRAHMPEGENFGLPALAERPVVPVARGVPLPRTDAEGALEAHRRLLADRPEDAALLVDAFALACALDRRPAAEELLRRWRDATAEERRLRQMFPEDEPRLNGDLLERLLPPAR
ncbi:MAG: hypothetical protein KF830_10465 [Planctomycetes bacterium]|nr:hypothetical protein [Planctomycetota bacterium]